MLISNVFVSTKKFFSQSEIFFPDKHVTTAPSSKSIPRMILALNITPEEHVQSNLIIENYEKIFLCYRKILSGKLHVTFFTEDT
jgi:hypothetical protein